MSKQNETLTLHGYSTALFATWYFIKEYGVLFDCGDGAAAGLMQSAGKIKHIFVSHADRDHLAGLLMFCQLHPGPKLRIYYPKDCQSFPHLGEFSSKFDPHANQAEWIPVEPGEEIRIREDTAIRAFANRHVESKLGVKSLSYRVESVHRKLKPELLGKNGSEIAMLRKEKGESAISDETRTQKLIYSGDTPIERDGRYDNTEILIHEATFLTAAELDPNNPKRNKHSSLDQVMEVVAESNIKQLVLGHFSSRYSYEQIDDAVRAERKRHGISIPIYRVLPGMLARNVFVNAKLESQPDCGPNSLFKECASAWGITQRLDRVM